MKDGIKRGRWVRCGDRNGRVTREENNVVILEFAYPVYKYDESFVGFVFTGQTAMRLRKNCKVICKQKAARFE